MKQTVSMLKRSFFELSNIQSLTFSSMLIAISIILGFYSIPITQNMRISFALIPVAIGGLIYGPIVGGIMGGLVDILNFLIKPMGPFSPGFTISSILTGMVFGFILYKRPITMKRSFLANLVVVVFINMLLNTFWLNILYGTPFIPNLIARTPKEIIMLGVNTVLLYTLAKSLKGHMLLK